MRSSLYRSVRNKKVAGVCAGLADYFDVDVALIRVAFIVGVVLHGIGLLAYVVLWIAVAENPSERWVPSYKTSGVGTASMPSGSPSADYGSYTYGQESLRAQEAEPLRRNGALIAGISLIIVGIYFLLVNLAPWFDFESYSPALLIVAGAGIIAYGFAQSPVRVKIDDRAYNTPVDTRHQAHTSDTTPSDFASSSSAVSNEGAPRAEANESTIDQLAPDSDGANGTKSTEGNDDEQQGGVS